MAATGFLFGDSFDYYADADRLQKWTNENIATNTGIAVTTSAVRNGSKGLRVSFPFGGWSTWSRTTINKTLFPGDPTTFVMGSGFRYTGGTNTGGVSFLGVYDNATPQVVCMLRTDGTIGFCRGDGTLLGTSSQAMLSGVYYHLKLKVVIHPSAGTFQAWLNGVSVFSGSGLNTRASGTSQWNVISLGNTGVNGGVGSDRDNTFDFDDLYVRDSDISRFDLTAIALHAQAGNGANVGYTPSAGTDHGANVDDTTSDGDTTYNYADTIGLLDTYAMDDVPTTAAIAFVQSVDVCRKVDPGDRLVANVFRIGGVNYVGSDLAPGQTYSHLLQPYDVSPATAAAFTAAEINAMEAGQKITG